MAGEGLASPEKGWGGGGGERGRNSKSRASARCSPLYIFVLFSICKIYICGRFFFLSQERKLYSYFKKYLSEKKMETEDNNYYY